MTSTTSTTIFFTGATGTMGTTGLHELLAHQEEYNYKIRVLTRPSRKNRRQLKPCADKIDIIWGDLRCYDDVLRGVTGADIVLHVGGEVSPRADYHPRRTFDTNIGAARNIRKAVLAQGDRQPAVVYIGSVAQMGDRREPLHWGRTGDPVCVSPYDHYSITKVLAERILTDGGIRRWVSLRQSGILYPAILKNYDPIMFHVPIRGVLEWATVEDSGRLLERVCRPGVPADFWNRYYNIGSGPEYRITNYEFETLILDAISCPRPEKIFNAHWFTTRNFHGMWYTDSDLLEDYLHFRANIPLRDYFRQMSHSPQLPFAIRLARVTKAAMLVPHLVKAAMWAMANYPVHGTQTWIRRRNTLRINAYYGSLEAYRAIPDWAHTDLSRPSSEVVRLDHGYDEQKPMSAFTLEDMQRAAAFRGGRCLSETMTTGDWDTPLRWQCAQGHTFEASPRLILLGGHWCPDCFPYPYAWEPDARPWQWDAEARRNPFFAQLWKPLHAPAEDNTYDAHLFDGWE
ncbi:MAG: NAD(P)-dependent oxidoreductase [Bacteroidaceae bacterium]|nr:NAD(P)-dependent oxidoreductase [Bacteroidaceae bacterium]